MNSVVELISRKESITLEFKSDQGPLGDSDLIDAVVCLANAQGGHLLIGVEDDGTVTGLHTLHQTRPEQLAALIANRTVPPIQVSVDFVDINVQDAHTQVAVVVVPTSTQPAATSSGRLLIRYLDSRGKPGCRPLYPNELSSWQTDRGQLDISAQVVSGTNWDDLDPLEFERLRR